MEGTPRSSAPWWLPALPYATLPSVGFHLCPFVTSKMRLWKAVTSILLKFFLGLPCLVILEASCYSESPPGKAQRAGSLPQPTRHWGFQTSSQWGLECCQQPSESTFSKMLSISYNFLCVRIPEPEDLAKPQGGAPHGNCEISVWSCCVLG